MRRIVLGLLGLSLAACGGPDATFKNGCNALAAEADDMNKEDRKAFCTCLGDKVAPLSDASKTTLGKLMKEAAKNDDIDTALDEAIKEGDLSLSDGQVFFGGLKACSIDLAQ